MCTVSKQIVNFIVQASKMSAHPSRNVEIKAKLVDIVKLHNIIATLASNHGTVLHQRDIFYSTQKGRLKMRFVKQVCKSYLLIIKF